MRFSLVRSFTRAFLHSCAFWKSNIYLIAIPKESAWPLVLCTHIVLTGVCFGSCAFCLVPKKHEPRTWCISIKIVCINLTYSPQDQYAFRLRSFWIGLKQIYGAFLCLCYRAIPFPSKIHTRWWYAHKQIMLSKWKQINIVKNRGCWYNVKLNDLFFLFLQVRNLPIKVTFS